MNQKAKAWPFVLICLAVIAGFFLTNYTMAKDFSSDDFGRIALNIVTTISGIVAAWVVYTKMFGGNNASKTDKTGK